MSLLFQKRLKKFKINNINDINSSKENTSLPSIFPKKFHFSQKSINNNNSNQFNSFIHPEEELVKSLNLNDTKTTIPFLQIINNTKINISNDDINKKRKEKLFEWELKDVDFNTSNKISLISNYEKIKEFKQKIYIEKLQVNEKEKMLKDKIIELENKLNSLKDLKNLVYQQIISFNQKMNQYKYDLEDIKLENNTNQNKIIQIKRRQTRFSIKQKNSIVNSLDVFESQKREYDNYQGKKNKVLSKINECEGKILKLKKEQDENNIKILEIKKEYKKIKNELLEHYHRILLEGVDTRKDGLSWVIESIWDLGEEVNLNYMPNFLDVQSINYLFNISKKNKLLQKVKIVIENFKEDSSKNLNFEETSNNNKLILSPIKINENENALSLSNIKENNEEKEFSENNNSNKEKKKYNIFRTGLNSPKYINDSHKLVKKIIDYKKPSLIKIKDYIKMKKYEELNYKDILNNRSLSHPNSNRNDKKITFKLFLNFDNENNSKENSKSNEPSRNKIKDNYMEKYHQLKLILRHIEKDIETLKNNELKRIWNEFIGNEYGKKYNIDKKIVISSLVGEHNMIKEIEKQKSISNKLKKIKKICSFYDTYENGKINSFHKISKKNVINQNNVNNE